MPADCCCARLAPSTVFPHSRIAAHSLCERQAAGGRASSAGSGREVGHHRGLSVGRVNLQRRDRRSSAVVPTMQPRNDAHADAQ